MSFPKIIILVILLIVGKYAQLDDYTESVNILKAAILDV
jgi:hypothetical protein